MLCMRGAYMKLVALCIRVACIKTCDVAHEGWHWQGNGRIVMHCTCSSTRIACSNCLLALGLLVRVLDSFGYKGFSSFVGSSFMA